MKAVILAAGFGSRMGSGLPKPLVRLFGIPLIEHKILKLKGYKIAVVYHDERVAEFIREKYPNITLIHNPYPEKENGYSLYCAKDFIKEGENFILLMADHYYGDKFFSNIFEEENKNIIFVSSYCNDPDEATKVKVENERVVKIGKGLLDYDYFDTGFFICTREVFIYAEKLLHREKIKLSDIMQEIANDRKLFYKVIDDFWIDIDTQEDLKTAEKLIRKSLIKKTDGFISKYINRQISTRITPFLTRFDFITPNFLTYLTAALGFFAGFLFLYKKYLLAGILTQVASVIDGCDGEIARLKNLSSKFGAVLDTVLDRYVDTFIIFAIFLSLEKNIALYIAFFLAITGSILVSYVSHLTGIRPYFATRDLRLFIIMLGAVLEEFIHGSMYITLWIIGIISHLAVLYSVLKVK